MKIIRLILIYGGLALFIFGVIGSINLIRTKYIWDNIRTSGIKIDFQIAKINCESGTIICQNDNNEISKDIGEYCTKFEVGQTISLINSNKYPDRYIFENDNISKFQIAMSLLICLIGLIPIIIFKTIDKIKSAYNTRYIL